MVERIIADLPAGYVKRIPDHVVDVVEIAYRGVTWRFARRKGCIMDWLQLGHLDALYRVNIYLKELP